MTTTTPKSDSGPLKPFRITSLRPQFTKTVRPFLGTVYWQLLHKALLSITFSGLDDDPTTSFARLGNPFSDLVGVEDLVQNELEF